MEIILDEHKINMKMITTEIVKCFICDVTIHDNIGHPVLSESTQYSNTSLPNKIGTLVGDKFMVVVNVNDKLCQRCLNLVNEFDKLECELDKVKNVLIELIQIKYDIDFAEISSTEKENELETDNFQNIIDEEQESEDQLESIDSENIKFSLKEPSLDLNKTSNFICSKCNLNFINQIEFKNHLLNEHILETNSLPEIMEKNYSCSNCEFICKSKFDIEEHLMKSHQTCDMCNISFSTKDLFEEHVTEKHSYVCNICSEHFNSEIDLDIHLKLHQNINELTSDKLVISKDNQESTSLLDNSDDNFLKINDNEHNIQNIKLINIMDEVNENQIEFTVIDNDETNYENVNDLFEKLDPHNNVNKNILSNTEENVSSNLIISSLNFSENEMENENGKIKGENETNIQIELDGKVLVFSENLDSEKLKEYLENSGIKLEIQEMNNEQQTSQDKNNLSNENSLKTFLTENYDQEQSLPQIIEENVLSNLINKKKMFECSICNLKTSSDIQMKRHCKTHLALETKMFECKICEKVFTTQSNLKRHLKNHENSPGKVSCNICSKELTDKLHLKHHLDKHHPEFYRCNYCQKTFSNKRGCKLHELLHESDTSVFCPFCDLVFKTEVRLSNHIDSTHKFGNQSKIYTCPYCNRTITTLTNFKRHIRNHDPNALTDICSICNQSFSDDLTLRKHIEEHHPNIYPCSLCDLIFETRKLCDEHESTHPEQIKCEECEQTFSTNQQLKKHTIIHRDSKCKYCNKVIEDKTKLYDHEKRHEKFKEGFKCEFCPKEFGTPSGLKYHMSIHTGKYNVYCEICGKGFHSEITLEEHRATHTKEIRFMCELCGRKFSSNSTYRMHRLWHDNPLPYTCNICNKKFKHTSILAVHKRRAHTGERPYKCPYCSQAFSVSSTLNKHIILHTRQYPFNCEVCKKGFTTRLKIAKHMVKAHNDHTLMNSQRKNCEYKMALKPSEISNSNDNSLNDETMILGTEPIQGDVTLLDSALSISVGEEEVENQVAVQTIDPVVSDYIIFE